MVTQSLTSVVFLKTKGFIVSYHSYYTLKCNHNVEIHNSRLPEISSKLASDNKLVEFEQVRTNGEFNNVHSITKLMSDNIVRQLTLFDSVS